MKHIRKEMVDAKLVDEDIISSFLVECLVWNIPNSTITRRNTWSETVKDSILL